MKINKVPKLAIGDVLTMINGGSKYHITHINSIAVELKHIRMESRMVVHLSEINKIFIGARQPNQSYDVL